LEHPKISYRLGLGVNDFSARGKVEFALEGAPEGYWFFLDDDNELMSGYTDYMAGKVEQYGRKCAVCVHGSVVDETGLWFFHKGTLCLHSSMIKAEARDFHPYTMVDLSFSLLFKEQGIGIINIQRPSHLLKHIAEVDDGWTKMLFIWI